MTPACKVNVKGSDAFQLIPSSTNAFGVLTKSTLWFACPKMTNLRLPAELRSFRTAIPLIVTLTDDVTCEPRELPAARFAVLFAPFQVSKTCAARAGLAISHPISESTMVKKARIRRLVIVYPLSLRGWSTRPPCYSEGSQPTGRTYVNGHTN